MLSVLPLAGEVGAQRRMRAIGVGPSARFPHPRLRRGLSRERERRTAGFDHAHSSDDLSAHKAPTLTSGMDAPRTVLAR